MVACCATGGPIGIAHGATAAFDGDTLVVTSDEASELQFRLTEDGTQDVAITNTSFTSYPAECTADVGQITCPGRNNLRLTAGPDANDVTFNSSSSINSTIPSCFESYEIDLGDGNNALRPPTTCPVPSSSITVTSGSGDDGFFAGRPGTGDDELGYCRGCADSNDKSLGADTYIGGAGNDKLWFDNLDAGVTISLDGVANDGAAGEGDNIGADIEEILATAGGVDRGDAQGRLRRERHVDHRAGRGQVRVDDHPRAAVTRHWPAALTANDGGRAARAARGPTTWPWRAGRPLPRTP